jgi:hypothetical protein
MSSTNVLTGPSVPQPPRLLDQLRQSALLVRDIGGRIDQRLRGRYTRLGADGMTNESRKRTEYQVQSTQTLGHLVCHACGLDPLPWSASEGIA